MSEEVKSDLIADRFRLRQRFPNLGTSQRGCKINPMGYEMRINLTFSNARCMGRLKEEDEIL